MTSLTLHLIVGVLLTTTALTATASSTTATTRSTTARPVGQQQRSRGAEAVVVSTWTTSTQAPTLRAPSQRCVPTTQPIMEISTTPLPVRQRSRCTTTTSIRTTPSATPIRTSNRGGIRAARQPRDMPMLNEYEGSTGSSSSNSWRHPLAVAAFLPAVSDVSRNGIAAGAAQNKTPRMIQRLVAGHIHNAHGHSTYAVSAVSTNSSTSRSTAATTPTPSPPPPPPPPQPLLNVRRKASSFYRLARPSPTPRPIAAAINNDNDDDEALLNDQDDLDNWENGILRLSAGSGKESEVAKSQSRQSKEDSKKTLADQVRDGKYGLIEKELFQRVPKRPGVLSYARNPEVPLDNDRNYGGLNQQDIWLAEDHLLIIKGGELNEAEEDGAVDEWPAIDDYDAPPRQIKLPANAAVPPPFPVQLEPHGPLQLIRDNKIEVLHTTSGNATFSADGQHSSYSQSNGASHGQDAYTSARQGASASTKTADPEPSYVYPAPYAPWLLYPNDTLGQQPPAHTYTSTSPNAMLKSQLLGPWVNVSVPRALHANISDFDEDDPSLYYPPAYSFVYKSNYSNPVPPGPLVPGIVLPPPPDHFSQLEAVTTTSTSTTTRRSYSSSTTSIPTTISSMSSTRTPARLTLKYQSIGYLPPARQPPKYVERVPVPVAVPIPIYPINYQPSTKGEQLVFVPSTSSTERPNGDRARARERHRDQAPLSKSNPIYYEYFEAKRQPSNVIDDFLTTKPPKGHHYKSPPSPVNDVAVLSITPKPRTQIHSEYDTALSQLLRSNLISPPVTNRFQAPDFDRQPFLPMVNYSADEQDQNAFKAIVYQPQPQRHHQLRVGKHQQLQPLQLERTVHPMLDPDSYLPRQLRLGKQQHLQLQSPVPYDSPQTVYSTPMPPAYLDNQLQSHPAKYQRPPAPVPFWQHPAAQSPPPSPSSPQFKRFRAKYPFPSYFAPSYTSGPGSEQLYRLLPVSQHKHWRQNSSNKPQQTQVQARPQSQSQQQYYSDRSVNIGHSLASDILVNYNSNNQFNAQAELVPQTQLGPPPLSYQTQNSGQSTLWSDRPVRQSQAQLSEQV